MLVMRDSWWWRQAGNPPHHNSLQFNSTGNFRRKKPLQMCLASSWTSFGQVAEKKRFWRADSRGLPFSIKPQILNTDSLKPMSNMRSASSRHKKLTFANEKWQSRCCHISRRSSRRPGVATTISAPRCNAPTCGPLGIPPTRAVVRIFFPTCGSIFWRFSTAAQSAVVRIYFSTAARYWDSYEI